MKPLCACCHKKPVKWSAWHCTMRCAAEEGKDYRMSDWQWCDHCQKWHDSTEMEYCESEQDKKEHGMEGCNKYEKDAVKGFNKCCSKMELWYRSDGMSDYTLCKNCKHENGMWDMPETSAQKFGWNTSLRIKNKKKK